MLMTDGIIDPSRKARRRATAVWFNRVFWCLIFAAGLYGAWRFGGEQNRQALEQLQKDSAAQAQTITAQKTRETELSAAAETAARKLADLEQRYDQNVPKGEVAALVSLMNQRLKDGVGPDRLAFVLEHVSADENCTAMETRSMVVTTPLVRGRAVNLTYEGGKLSISGSGQSAQGDSGSPESWYDPSAVVALRLVPQSGAEVTLSGKLPLQKTVVAGDARLNFLVAEGDRGRVNVSGQRCAFP